MFNAKAWLLLLVIGLVIQLSCAKGNRAQQGGNRWDSSGKKGGNWGQNDGSSQDRRSWNNDGQQQSNSGGWDSRDTQVKDSNTWNDGGNEQHQGGNWGPNDMQTKDGGSWNADGNQQEGPGMWRPQDSQVKQDGNWNSQNWGPGDSQEKDGGKWMQPSESGRFSPNDIQVKDGNKPPQEPFNPADRQVKEDGVWDMSENMGNVWGPRDSQEKVGGKWNPSGGQTQNEWTSMDTQRKDTGSWDDGGNRGAFGPMDTQGKIGDNWNPNDGQKKVDGDWNMDGNRPSDGNWGTGSPGGTTWGPNDGQDGNQGNLPGWTPDGMQGGGGAWDQSQDGRGGNWPSTDQGGISGPSGGGDVGNVGDDYGPTPENARGDTGVTHIPPVGTAGGVGQGNYKGGDAGSYPGDDPSQWRIEDSIPGMPGVDYPNYDTVPNTGFDCKAQENPGYYGDVDAQCQVFHICQSDGRHDSFLCPLGTIFNQQYFVCDWWFNFNCADTPTYYNLNANLYKVDPDAQGNFKGDTYGRGITEGNFVGAVGDTPGIGTTSGIDYRQDDVTQNLGTVGTRPDIFSPTEASVVGGGIQNVGGIGITDSGAGGYGPGNADQPRIQGNVGGSRLPGGNVDASGFYGGGQDGNRGVGGKPNVKGGLGSPNVPSKPWDSGQAAPDVSAGGPVGGQSSRGPNTGKKEGGNFDGGKKGGNWGSSRNWGAGVKGGQVSLWEADGTSVIARQGNLWDRVGDSLNEGNEQWDRSDVASDISEYRNLESPEVAQGSNFKTNAVLSGEEFRDASVQRENWVHPGVNQFSKGMNSKWTFASNEKHEVKTKIDKKEKLRNSDVKLRNNVLRPNRRAQTRSWNGSISGNDRNWWKESKIRNTNNERNIILVSSESSPSRQNITSEASNNSSMYFDQNPNGRKRSRPRGRKSNGYNGTWKLLS